MDMGVIAAHTRHVSALHLNRTNSWVEHRAELRRASQHLKAGMRGLDEVLEATDLVQEPLEDFLLEL